MRVLELFSGTGSVSKVCQELGYDVVSVDISDKFHTPTIKVDIMTWDYKSAFPKGHFDIVWASPPCNTFSILNNINYTKADIKKRIKTQGLPLLRKAEEIIDYFQPKIYVMENPKGFMADYVKNRPLYLVDYCKYADFGYRKSTHIWTNKKDFVPLTCRKNCNSMTPDGKKHRLSVCRTTKLENRYRVPFALVRDLLLLRFN